VGGVSPPLAIERRLAAVLLILLGALPLLTTYLPHAQTALLAPGLAVCPVFVALLLPIDRRLQAGAAVLGGCTLVLFDLAATGPRSLSLFFLVPLILRAVRIGPRSGLMLLTPFAIAVASLYAAGNLESGGLQGISISTTSDIVGLVALLGLIVWLTFDLVMGQLMRNQVFELSDACDTLDNGIKRDHDELLRIANLITSPDLEHQGQISGQGLSDDVLNIVTSIGRGKIMIAQIRGRPLTTLSAAWALRACARGGMYEPASLLEFASCHLDEICRPSDVEWIGIYDSKRHHCSCAPVGSLLLPKDIERRDLRPFEAPLDTSMNARTLGRTIDAPTPIQRPRPRDESRARLIDLSLGMILPIGFLGCAGWLDFGSTWAVAWSLVWSLTAVTIELGLAWRHGRVHAHALSLEEASEDRIECHDDVHNQIARLHGGLLPYQIQVGPHIATAHRLRGMALEGSFADMLVDSGGHARIFSGEIKGQGIAARFLGMEAQFAVRTRLSDNHACQVPWTSLLATVRQQLAHSSAGLRFPLRFRAGLVSFDRDGLVVGEGSLKDLIVLEGASTQPTLADRSHLGPCTRIYLSPSASLAGPEDDAPQLDAADITKRAVSMITGGHWKQGDGTLASLFSLVFDGDHASAHGTLIELHHAMADENLSDHESELTLAG